MSKKRNVSELIEEVSDGIMRVDMGDYFVYHDPNRETITRVMFEGKYNYLNKDKKFISKDMFDIATEFEYGIACVNRKNKWNFINLDGKYVCKKWYDEVYLNKKFISDRWCGIIHLYNKGYNFVNRNGKIMFKKWFKNIGQHDEKGNITMYVKIKSDTYEIDDNFNILLTTGFTDVSEKW